MLSRFLNRIDPIDNIDILASEVCKVYSFGQLTSVNIIPIGYEDFNAIINTESGKYLMKVFNNNRSDQEVQECINRSWECYKNGVPTPKIYTNVDSEIVSNIRIGKSKFRVSIIEYIDGKDFFSLGERPNINELKQIVNIASSIAKISYKPNFIYDKWAISSFCNEFEQKEKFLDESYVKMIKPVYERFKNFDYNSLPKSFVHGDMMSTNLIKDKNNNIWLIDFSVSNYTARINEIAVICDDVALVHGDKKESEKRVKMCFDLWCSKVNPTPFEIQSFKMIYDVANAINVMNSAYEIYEGNTSNETYMHLNAGMFALTLFDGDNISAQKTTCLP